MINLSNFTLSFLFQIISLFELTHEIKLMNINFNFKDFIFFCAHSYFLKFKII